MRVENRLAASLARAFFFGALALGAGVSCAKSPEKEQTIVYNLGVEPETLDPAKSTGVAEHRAITALINGLTRLDADGIAQPAMAERWEANEDHSAFTFHLREANWSSGDPVTAEDFVWSWRRVVDPETASDYAYQLYYIKNGEALNSGKESDFSMLGAEAADDRTIIVNLEGPTPFFPALAAHSAYYPVHRPTVEGNPAWHLSPETYVGNGPFVLKEWRHHNRIVMEKSPSYWDAGAVKLERLVYRMLEEESTALAAFETGQLDITGSVPRPDIPALRDTPEFGINPFLGTYYLGFNCERAPFDNVLVRKAFTLAIDRKILVEKITMGGEEPAFAWVPPAIINPATGKSYRREKNEYFPDNDIEGAREALAEAGYPDGKGFPTVRYIYNTAENHRVIAEVLQQMWAKALNVEVSLENQEWKTYLDNRDKGNFDVSRAGWIGDFPDPVNFLDVFISTSGNNNSHWVNLEYDELIRKIKSTADQAERFMMMHEAEDIFMAEFPICPIYYYTEPYLQKTYVHGVERNGLGWWDFSKAWIDEK
jgi:oligopeptide transport system substrate-binding protein